MQLHNYTDQELFQLVETSDNTLAKEALKRAQDDATKDNIIYELKQALSEQLAEKIDDCAKQFIEDCEKDGFEFNSIVEAYYESVAYELEFELDKFKEHIEAHAYHDQTFINGEWIRHHCIDDKAVEILENLTDDQLQTLAEKAAYDIPSAFTVDTYRNYYSKGSFYTASFGELESDIEHLDLNIPTDDDNEPLLSDDDLNNNLSNCYLSNNYIYIDMTDSGIEWRINLDWLEEKLLELKENEHEA